MLKAPSPTSLPEKSARCTRRDEPGHFAGSIPVGATRNTLGGVRNVAPCVARRLLYTKLDAPNASV